MVKPPIHI